MRSIERMLLVWVLGALASGSVLVAAGTYVVTLDEMHEIFDAELRNVAQALGGYRHAERNSRTEVYAGTTQRTDIPAESEIVTLIWTQQGERIFSSDPRVLVPFTTSEGLAHPIVKGEKWIVYSSVGQSGTAQAAQRMAARQQMARESAAKVLPPLVGLALLVGAFLVYGLRRGLQPLDTAARHIASRSARSFDVIRLGDAPKELSPLVGSINELMGRLALAFSGQQRFLADAAHELRTPMTALRLQLQLLERSADEVERRQAMAELAAGINRSQHLIEQLLQVARLEPDAESLRRAPIDLAELVRTIVSSFSIKAEHAGIDLGSDAPASVVVEGDSAQVTALLNNLVENALRYTPAAGVIDVAAVVLDGQAVLRVVDSGPGIAQAERERVFERFYRGDTACCPAQEYIGTGLGLAIVKAIADRHGAQVTLRTPESGQGLEVRVTFPAERPVPPSHDSLR